MKKKYCLVNCAENNQCSVVIWEHFKRCEVSHDVLPSLAIKYIQFHGQRLSKKSLGAAFEGFFLVSPLTWLYFKYKFSTDGFSIRCFKNMEDLQAELVKMSQ